VSGVLAAVAGAGGIQTALNAAQIGDTEETSPNPSSSVSINRDGTVSFTGNSSDSDPINEWVINPVGNPGDNFEVHLAVTSGSGPNAGDSTATWLALTSNRSWTRTGGASASGTWTISIRPVGKSTVASALITMANTYIP